jgi:hypothetical protein
MDLVTSLHLPVDIDLPLLEALSLSRCISGDLNAFIPNCPLLRAVRVHDICLIQRYE